MQDNKPTLPFENPVKIMAFGGPIVAGQDKNIKVFLKRLETYLSIRGLRRAGEDDLEVYYDGAGAKKLAIDKDNKTVYLSREALEQADHPTIAHALVRAGQLAEHPQTEHSIYRKLVIHGHDPENETHVSLLTGMAAALNVPARMSGSDPAPASALAEPMRSQLKNKESLKSGLAHFRMRKALSDIAGLPPHLTGHDVLPPMRTDEIGAVVNAAVNADTPEASALIGYFSAENTRDRQHGGRGLKGAKDLIMQAGKRPPSALEKTSGADQVSEQPSTPAP